MNTNLLDLNNEIRSHWWLCNKYNLDIILKEKLKQDMLGYVDIKIKIERKEERKGKYHVSRSYTRYFIWLYFVEFCRNRFGIEYLIDNDKYVEINKIYNER